MISYISNFSKISLGLLAVFAILLFILIIKSVQLTKETDENAKKVYRNQVIAFSVFSVLSYGLFVYSHFLNGSDKLENMIKLVSDKTNINVFPLMLLALFIVLFISLIVESVSFSKEVNQSAKVVYRNNVITLSVFSTLSLCLFLYLQFFQNSQKNIAYRLMALSSQPKTDETLNIASKLCDDLFNKSDKGIRDQFFDMKQKRPVEETRNMCFSYARTLTGQ